MSIEVETSKDHDAIEEFLLPDRFSNIYIIGDIEARDEKAKFSVAKDGDHIIGILLSYEFDDYPVLWLYDRGSATMQLLDRVTYGKFVMITGESSVQRVLKVFKEASVYRESVMHAHRSEVRYYHNPEVRKLEPDDSYAWAKSINNGEEPDNKLIKKAETKLINNDCFGLFCGEDIVSRGVIDVKTSYGWAIGGMYTLPSFRNRGYATSVMSGIIEAASEEINDFVLYVRENNKPAVKSYARSGFRPIAKRVFIDFNTGTKP